MENMQLLLDKFSSENKIELINRIPESKYVTYKANFEGKLIILKTHSREEDRIRIQNEIDWYKSPQLVSVKRPKLIATYDYEKTLIILIEFIEGESYQDKLEAGSFDEEDIKTLAKFTEEIESMEYIATIKSDEKKNMTDEQWNELFKKSASNWYESIQQKLAELGLESKKELIDNIYNSTLNFDIANVGRGGQHGSPKLREFIQKDEVTYVVDWENSTSTYIKYYMTASISSFLFSRLKLDKLAKDYLKYRTDLLSNEDKETFNNHFKPIFSQRLLGNIYDLFFSETLLHDQLLKKIKYIEENSL
jgi:hypothetical protein